MIGFYVVANAEEMTNNIWKKYKADSLFSYTVLLLDV